MLLLEPVWLVIAVPLTLAFLARRPPSRTLSILRAALYALIVLAMANPGTRRVVTGGTVIVIADRSASMPDGAQAEQLEALRTLNQTRGPADQLGVVTFGARALIEKSPSDQTAPTTFTTQIDASASNLNEALTAALSLAPTQSPARLLVLSDGRTTDGDALGQAARASERRIPIDHRSLQRADLIDPAIAQITAPLRVGPGESFLIDAWVASPRGGPTNYALSRAGEVIARGVADLDPGGGRLTFRDIGRPGATLAYELLIEPQDTDAVLENNRARVLVGVRDEPAVLAVSQTPGQGLAALLTASGLTVDAKRPEAVDWSEASLAGYAAIVLENVAIQDIGLQATQAIAQLVEQRGTGLVMTGGQRSFAAGGYLDTPIERVLPVSLELRQEYRILAAAIVVALDRSGSMGVPVAGGATKMRLAGEASAAVLEMMTPIDRFGAIAIDSEPDIVAPLRLVSESQGVAERLRRLQAGGGGIYVFRALTAAANMLVESDAVGTKHIVLFADAADAEAPGDYQQLLETAANAGITVSVVALGTKLDPDAALLEDIARLGSGRALFTDDARILPQLFAQDALAVVRGGFLDEPTAVQYAPGLRSLLNTDLGQWPTIGGYNPTFPKNGADVAAVTADEFAAPVVAQWTAGLGRVAVYTGEADGRWSGDFGQWDQSGSLLASLVRSVLADNTGPRDDLVVRQRLEPGALRIDVYADRASEMDRPTVRTLRVSQGQTNREDRKMAPTASDRLSVSIPLGGTDTLIPAIELDGSVIPLAPATLPYSPEHRPDQTIDGDRVLQRISDRTGGKARAALSSIWDELPKSAQLTPLRPWLAVLAVLVFLFEIAERRIGVLDLIGWRPSPRPTSQPTRQPATNPTASSAPAPTASPADPPVSALPKSPPPAKDSAGVLGALRDMKDNRN